jgi:uncharacterized membrane protein
MRYSSPLFSFRSARAKQSPKAAMNRRTPNVDTMVGVWPGGIMTAEYVLLLLARWLHILSAAVALGVPIYVRLVLLPALATVDDETRGRLGEAIARRWRLIVYSAITLFLVTGLYNYLVVARWSQDDFPSSERPRYHMLFGIKFLVALGMFFIASALAGRSAKLAPMRANARLWLTVLIMLGILIVVLSGIMRFMP